MALNNHNGAFAGFLEFGFERRGIGNAEVVQFQPYRDQVILEHSVTFGKGLSIMVKFPRQVPGAPPCRALPFARAVAGH
jgi:hypothetical protein